MWSCISPDGDPVLQGQGGEVRVTDQGACEAESAYQVQEDLGTPRSRERYPRCRSAEPVPHLLGRGVRGQRRGVHPRVRGEAQEGRQRLPWQADPTRAVEHFLTHPGSSLMPRVGAVRA